VSFISPRQFAPVDPDAHLLLELHAVFGPDHFDESSISGNVAFEPALVAALTAAGLDPRLKGGFLTLPALGRVRRWLALAEGRPIDGLRLTCDKIGWYTLEGLR
jgi:hypothetical protein